MARTQLTTVIRPELYQETFAHTSGSSFDKEGSESDDVAEPDVDEKTKEGVTQAEPEDEKRREGLASKQGPTSVFSTAAETYHRLRVSTRPNIPNLTIGLNLWYPDKRIGLPDGVRVCYAPG